MKKSFLFLLALTPCTVWAEDFGVRLILGGTDASSKPWDGSLTVRGGGSVRTLEGWRFADTDAIVSKESWKCASRRMRVRGANANRAPMVGNGVVAQLTGVSNQTVLEVRTAQGDFTVRLGDIPYGKPAMAMDGRVYVDRIPATEAILESDQEQDYPAAATSSTGEVWLAWLEFRHHPEHNRLRANFTSEPANFDERTLPAGGDQVFARKWANGEWSAPVAVSEPGKDLYRPAIAVDGGGRAWVFWSENANYGPFTGNQPGAVADFDLWARPVEGSAAGAPIRISKAAGSDVFPAAATDSAGRVWVTWQGWRDGRARIFVSSQKEGGGGFSAPMEVAASKANEWNPSIAAGAGGRMTIAWDTYRNGSYDVMMRTLTNGRWGREMPAAATARYEAHPSISYAPDGRLWLAFEEGSELWGKDWGADESSGVSLYQGRAVRVRAFEPDGKMLDAVSDVGSVLPGPANAHVEKAGLQADSTDWFAPQPDRWKNRPRSGPTQGFGAVKNSYPRLLVDASGRVWLAVRSSHPTWWNTLGTVWSEYVTSYAGGSWTGAAFLAHSDAVLDNRPALASPKAGTLMIMGSSDGRRESELGRGRGGRRRGQQDPYDFDLYAHTVVMGPAAEAARTGPSSAAMPAGRAPDAAEQLQVSAMRAARIEGKYRIARGEFHRHSEVSGDGGGDGSLLDQWRYALDASYMDWVGCCDHDNGGGREYTWWTAQKLTDVFYSPGRFVPMFSYERSVRYPEGHRNVIFAQRNVRTLPRLPITGRDKVVKAPDTQMLYRYLKQFNGIVAMHTSGTNMGTDWRDNDPLTEPVVEIYQGERQNYEMPGAPRTNSAGDSIGGWEPKGFVNLALDMGYKLAFEASSDHISTHMSYSNVLTTDLTRGALLDAFQKRHVYGATDNILAEFSSGGHIMGDEFTTVSKPEFKVKLAGTAPFARVHVIKDGKYAYVTKPNAAKVSFSWRDSEPVAGKVSYYYVRGEQADGEVVWVSPMWVTYKEKN
ncbi:MAG: DUF3604 domain-containing protein [Bryobacteraceae bacterium]